jgi:hypothetical protein
LVLFQMLLVQLSCWEMLPAVLFKGVRPWQRK